jgi:predicted MFS family arabinose efflux permease
MNTALRADPLRNPWSVVAGALIGLIVANGPVMLFTYGILLTPVTEEFGWLRANFGLAILFCHVSAALTVPFVGRLIDRHGIRRVVLTFIVLFAASIAAIGLTPSSPFVFIALYTLAGVFSAGQTVMPYAKAVAAVFDAKRGLALGIALAGVGIGTTLAPVFTHFVVDNFGWRAAYFALGLVTFALAFPAVALLVGQADARLLAPGKRDTESILPGITGREAARTLPFWAIGVGGFLVASAVNGAIPHVPPILIEHGFPRDLVPWIQGAAGISAIAGRVVSGYLLDRFFASYVALGFFALPVLGLVLLASGPPDAVTALTIVICLGLGLGAEIDTMGYMASRYFGLKRFGEIYGYVFGMFALGSGFGPLFWDLVFDATGGYGMAMTAAIAAIIIAGALVARLGPYVYPAPKHEARVQPAPAT